MKKLRWGVIGAGGIADRRTIPGMMLANNAELIAVMEINMELAEKSRAKWGCKRAYDSEAALLADPEIDAVYIASPVVLHAKQAMMAADAGKHILIEKPLAMTSEEGQKVVDYCESKGVKIAAGLMMRFGAYVMAMKQAIADGKAQIMYNTKVTELLVEGDKCVGVKAGDLEFRAPSVVLATGGYSYNEDLLKMAGFENVISCAPSTSNGSGFLLAQAVGGVFDNMDEIVNYYGGGIPTNGFDMYYQVNNSYPGMIYVNAQGDRVGAEESATSAMWYGQEESKLYAVISGNMIDEEQSFIKHPMMNSAVLENNGWDKLEELAAEGNCVYKADTLEELAEMIGAENLTATVEAYNKDVAAGEDTAFGRSAESMVAFEEGPYYAVVTVPYVWSGTSGGVRANEDGYLQREDGTVITGLSLAGEILGPSNILGKINFGGINHSMCATWGIIAAENAAALAGK